MKQSITPQPYQSHESLSPREKFAVLGATRLALAAAGRDKLQALVDLQEQTTPVDFGIDQRFNPSVPAGKLVTQQVESQANIMGNVVSLEEARVAKQVEEAEPVTSPEDFLTSEDKPLDVQLWEEFALNNANSNARPSAEILNDIQKAA